MIDANLVIHFLATLPLLLVSLVAHELAHGLVADRLGDPTPRLQGRLTLNPLAHLDIWGTIVLVVSFLGSAGTFFFGWAKPVKVGIGSLPDPQRGMMLVGLAGPAANALLALVAAGLVWQTYSWSPFISQILRLAFTLNVILSVFNLLPIPPLDGSRVLGGILPRGVYEQWSALDRYGPFAFFILFVVMFTTPQVFSATVGRVLGWAFVLLP